MNWKNLVSGKISIALLITTAMLLAGIGFLLNGRNSKVIAEQGGGGNASIQIDKINGQGPPFNFVCPSKPLFSPVTITGSGNGSAPPGQIDQYHVQIDWGDNIITNNLGTFNPPSGQGSFTFTFTAGPHTYASGGNYNLKARLYHSQPPGNDNQADAVVTIPICVVVQPECTPGATTTCSTSLPGICAEGTKTCQSDGTWGSCVQNNVSTTENCSNQLDDDCDGYTDNQDPDCLVESLCGNGIKEEGEECDGEDGVTPGQNFCTVNCKLVPIYSGPRGCPEGKVKSQNPIMTFAVSANDPDGERVNIGLSQDGYLIEVSGTFIPTSASGYESDAGYTLVNGTVSSQYGIRGTGNDFAAHALLSDFGYGDEKVGVVDWGDYNENHIYTIYYVPYTNWTRFVIGDRYSDWFNTPWQNQAGMNDNSGSLTVKIYACTTYSISGVKYHDENGNGQMDGKEESLAGWLIIIYKVLQYGNLEEVERATTTENGYTFSNLLPGDYQVCEINYDGWWVTDPWSGRLINPCVPVSLDNEDVEVNFGNFEPVFIGGYKFNDLDQDGEKDENEEYLNDWIIRLYQLAIEHCDGESGEECEEGSEYWNPVGSHPTGEIHPETGKYGWDRLGPGTYFVCEVISDHQNWVETYPNEQTGVPNQSGMGDEAPYCHQVIVNESGKDYINLNFGNYYPTSEQPEQPPEQPPTGGTVYYTLSVSKTGNGSGVVVSNVGGINCGSNCADSFAHGTTVTLTATPDENSTFEGWSGACSGTSNTCAVAMYDMKSVVAEFKFKPVVLGEATTTEGEVLGEATTTPTTVPTGVLGEIEIITPETITFLATLWFTHSELKRRKKR